MSSLGVIDGDLIENIAELSDTELLMVLKYLYDDDRIKVDAVSLNHFVDALSRLH